MDHEAGIQAIAHQEQRLSFEHFDEDTSWRIGGALRERARASGLPLVIEVSLFSRRLFFASLPGATPDNAEWARRKANVVRRFHRSSYLIGLRNKHAGTTLAAKWGLSPADYADHGGSFPIRVSSVGVIGTVTVSGLPQHEDHCSVVEALANELKIDYQTLITPPTASSPL